ncbi:hypothetical protein OCL06_09655 [Alteromonas sp. ASW11-19]|uniref:Lipoprotein n=1 Tax=Alteromonas salexigens TaxID=2982530 RepID=A0ABT2VR23_9ALTE|nr:hypothetical protein [Alteromonas salexigens]MCU7554863.1 hypothetical protein [Alteromonas salexigens]
MECRTCWLVAVLFVLTACSNTTVHVNTRYLDEQQIADVTQALRRAEFKVKTNAHPYPAGVYSTTVLYSPLLRDRDAVFRLESAVSENWPVSHIRVLQMSNHWYSRRSIGLYIVPDNINPQSGLSAADLSQAYRTLGCNASGQLTLHDNGEFTLNLAQQEISGNWHITSFPYIELNADAPYLHTYLEVSQHTEVDKVSPVKVTTLTPMEDKLLPDGCALQYGIRET